MVQAVINQAGITLIKGFEGLRLKPYQDSGGVWTVGYGHTHNVTGAMPSITQEQADAFLHEDIDIAQRLIQQYISVLLNENQEAAVTSLVFNEGSAPLKHTLGALLNIGDYTGAAAQFGRWIYVNGKVLAGLVNRRESEKELFLTPC